MPKKGARGWRRRRGRSVAASVRPALSYERAEPWRPLPGLVTRAGGLGPASHSRIAHNRSTAIDTLNSRQRAHLKSLAHPLKPVLHVGKEGVTEAAVRALEETFRTRELAKVRVLETAPDTPHAIGEALAGRLQGVQVVQTIGRIVVLFRRHPDRPAIQLPA